MVILDDASRDSSAASNSARAARSQLADPKLQLVLLVIAGACALYARTALSPMQEAVRVSLSLSDNQMAVLQGPAMALPYVLLSVPLGLAIDRNSRVRLIALIAACNLAGTTLTALAPSFPLLLLARCLVGIAATMIGPVSFSLLADLFAPEQRGRAATIVMIGQFAGIAGAFALGGHLLGMFAGEAHGWRPAMLWFEIPLILALPLLFAMREPLRTCEAAGSASARPGLLDLWSLRARLVPLFLGMIMVEIASGALLVWAAPALSRGFHASADQVGTIMSLVVLVGGIAGSIAGGLIADWCERTGGPRRTFSALCLLALSCSAPAGLLLVVTDLQGTAFLLTLALAIIGAVIVGGMTLATVIVPTPFRGVVLASMVGANILFGVAIAPLVVSLLSIALGGPRHIGEALALVCILSGTLACIALGFGRSLSKQPVDSNFHQSSAR